MKLNNRKVEIIGPTSDVEKITYRLNEMLSSNYIAVLDYKVHVTPEVVANQYSANGDTILTVIVEYEDLTK